MALRSVGTDAILALTVVDPLDGKWFLIGDASFHAEHGTQLRSDFPPRVYGQTQGAMRGSEGVSGVLSPTPEAACLCTSSGRALRGRC
jgi:hypothetical protein